MTDVTLWVLDELIKINNFEQIFLIVVAIVLSKPITIYASDLYLDVMTNIRKNLKLTETDKPSNRSILSVLYLLSVAFFWFYIGKFYPDLAFQKKIISTVSLPFLSATAFFIFITGFSLIFMIPYDLMVFIFFITDKFSKKNSTKG